MKKSIIIELSNGKNITIAAEDVAYPLMSEYNTYRNCMTSDEIINIGMKDEWITLNPKYIISITLTGVSSKPND